MKEKINRGRRSRWLSGKESKNYQASLHDAFIATGKATMPQFKSAP